MLKLCRRRFIHIDLLWLWPKGVVECALVWGIAASKKLGLYLKQQELELCSLLSSFRVLFLPNAEDIIHLKFSAARDTTRLAVLFFGKGICGSCDQSARISRQM